MSIHNTMITIFVRDCNQISQSFYDSVIYDLQLHQLTCSCSHSACLSVHGYYKRTVKLSSGAIRLRVCRVKCSECGATHALLLSSMVPYSQIPLSDQQRICKGTIAPTPHGPIKALLLIGLLEKAILLFPL